MKLNFDKRRILAASVAAACAWMGADANAASHTVSVAATVVGKCTFDASNSTVNLTVDPTLTSVITAPANVVYKCTKGTTPTFVPASASTSSATGGNLTGGTESFAYTYSSSGTTAGTGFGGAEGKTHVVTVSIDQSLAANVSAQSYTDTIVVTLTP